MYQALLDVEFKAEARSPKQPEEGALGLLKKRPSPPSLALPVPQPCSWDRFPKGPQDVWSGRFDIYLSGTSAVSLSLLSFKTISITGDFRAEKVLFEHEHALRILSPPN